MVLTIGLLFHFFISTAGAQEAPDSVTVPTVIIEDGSEARSPIDHYSTFKVEKVSPEKFLDPNRQSLADLVKDQVGVDTQVYCANCGAKRLTINGLKGEHTSILVDGIPLHSAVSSFYGVDAVPVLGLAEVEVMRGAGASLTNPEAIGGTLNLVTVNPLDMKNQASTSLGVDDRFFGQSQNHSLLYGLKGDSKKWGLVFGGQFARQETWDQDNNNVSEMPQRQSYNGLIKSRFTLGKKNDFTLRLGRAELEILGGYWDPRRPSRVRPVAAVEGDFVNGSVEELYLGEPNTITDWVDIKRNEAALTGTHYINDSFTLDWKFGYARQAQSAIYQHGFDYANIDNMFVGDVHADWSLPSGIITLGLFAKDQRLRSASETLFNQLNIARDSFDFKSNAIYGQWTVFFGQSVELNFAVRADRVNINWIDLSNQIDEWVYAPRFQLLHNFNGHLSQRFSYGLGYRAPLTFFESQHGNNETGYLVDIEKLEKADSLVYSLSYNTPTYYVTSGVHYTYLKNMAYGFERQSLPILYQNTDEKYDIWVADFLTGIKPLPWWFLELSLEYFQYEDGYKRKLPTAAIEKRAQFKSTIEVGRWQHLLRANIVAARDLSKYGSYNEHYVNRNQAFEPNLDPNLELKNQRSPTFVTFDTSATYQFTDNYFLTFGIDNVFNYTQAGVGDNPSTWHWHFDHAHFDGLHTWGPNSGRQFFLKVNGYF